MMKKRIIIATLAFAAIAGCQKQSDQNEPSSSDTVKFSSSDISTRLTEILDGDTYYDAWEGNDRIGISSQGYTSNGFYQEYSNVEHAVEIEEPSRSVDFTVLSYDNALLKPNTMTTNITYYAYYPFTHDVDEDGYITVDISAQNAKEDGKVGDADFIVAQTTITTPQDEVSFDFSHVLSKVIFKVSFDDEVAMRTDASLSALEGAIAAYTQAKYDREGNCISIDGTVSSSIYMSSSVSGDQATFTVILHPGNGFASNLSFYINDNEYRIDDISDMEFKPNTIYSYNVVLGRSTALISGSTISPWVSGTPTGSTSLEAESNEVLATYWDGTVAKSFNGVAYSNDVNEYEITNARELALMYQISADTDMTGKTFTMTNDIHLSDQAWIPIISFDGTFDGAGYTISGLNIDSQSGGVFYENFGTIQNLTVEGTITNAGEYSGAIVGWNYGIIEGCCSNVNISGSNNFIGGIVGYLNGGTVKSCYNIGTINATGGTSQSNIGGITGYNSKTIEMCYNLGEVKAGGLKVGGIAGGFDGSGTVENCYNRADITGSQYVGGIVGDSFGEVISVYNTNKVTATSSASDPSLGGILGRNYSGNLTYAFTYLDSEITTGVIGYDRTGSLDPQTNYFATFTDPSEDITIGDETNSLVMWLNQTQSSGGAWSADESNQNDGYPILNSINY